MADVVGSADLVLEAREHAPIGDTLAIAWRSLDVGAPVDRWSFQCEADVVGGLRIRVGEVSIVPAAALVSPRVLRVVAGAYCPGVVRWYVRARCSRLVALAAIELVASVSVAPAIGRRAWAWSVAADGADLLDQRADPQVPITYADALVVVGRALFASAWGTNEGASRRWVQLFDSAVVPADGTAPLESAGADPGASWRIIAEETLPLRSGLALVASSTPGILTHDAAATLQIQRRMRALPEV